MGWSGARLELLRAVRRQDLSLKASPDVWEIHSRHLTSRALSEHTRLAGGAPSSAQQQQQQDVLGEPYWEVPALPWARGEARRGSKTAGSREPAAAGLWLGLCFNR